MSVEVKICGINDPSAMTAAVEGGARYAGFVFYPPSPRAVSADRAADLAELAPAAVKIVGLFVDPTDDELDAALRSIKLDMVQLHGDEMPERVAQIRALAGVPVMKAIPVATANDLRNVSLYEAVADWLLFDAKVNARLPGGNGAAFDWSLLRGRRFAKPWMLAGGLNAANLAEAVATTAARVIDVSSGVEDAPGRKNPEKIRALLQLATGL